MIKEKMDQIFNLTDSCFHDAILNRLTFNFQDQILEIAIEQYKEPDNSDLKGYYLSTFSFKNIDNLEITNFYKDSHETINDEIGAFDYEQVEKRIKIIIETKSGSYIIFTTDDFLYEERFNE